MIAVSIQVKVANFGGCLCLRAATPTMPKITLPANSSCKLFYRKFKLLRNNRTLACYFTYLLCKK